MSIFKNLELAINKNTLDTFNPAVDSNACQMTINYTDGGKSNVDITEMQRHMDKNEQSRLFRNMKSFDSNGRVNHESNFNDHGIVHGWCINYFPNSKQIIDATLFRHGRTYTVITYKFNEHGDMSIPTWLEKYYDNHELSVEIHFYPNGKQKCMTLYTYTDQSYRCVDVCYDQDGQEIAKVQHYRKDNDAIKESCKLVKYFIAHG